MDTSSRDLIEYSTVQGYLEGKQVLITGVTGFLGKVLLEKLLRAVPGIGGITLLIRGNSSSGSAGDRFRNEIAASSVFDHLRDDDPELWQSICEKKITCLTGDVTEPFFGWSEAGFVELAQDVDAVINAAASVNFRQELDQALDINVLCLRNLADLVKWAGNVPLIHVSTCYVHNRMQGRLHEETPRPVQEGMEYDSDGTCQVERLLEYLQSRVREVRQRYSGERLRERLVELGLREANRLGWNDVYTLTKWLGEQLLLRELRYGSLTILRPSIIESTLEEPVPGWIEGIKVADIIIMAYARGKVLVFPGRRAGVVDVIPADLAANSIILSLAEQLQSPGGHRIYQCCTGTENPLTLGELIDHVVREARFNHRAHERVFTDRPRLPFIAVNRHLFWMFSKCVFLPLRLVERGLQTLGRTAEGSAVEHLRTTLKLADVFGAYSCPHYVFDNRKLAGMASRMGENDRSLFPVDPVRIDWSHYIRGIHLPGLNRYALQSSRA